MYAVLIYGFPLTLLAFEWGLRVIIEVDSSAFTGPTLAAAGLSFLMPLVKPKQRHIEGHDNVVVISKTEANFIPLIWIFVLAFLFCWTLSCYVAIKYPLDKTFGVDSHLFIGGVLYTVSLVFTAIKEKV